MMHPGTFDHAEFEFVIEINIWPLPGWKFWKIIEKKILEQAENLKSDWNLCDK